MENEFIVVDLSDLKLAFSIASEYEEEHCVVIDDEGTISILGINDKWPENYTVIDNMGDDDDLPTNTDSGIEIEYV